MDQQLERLYKKNNPFKNDNYIFNAYMYLYNKKIISTYGGSSIDVEFKERKQYKTITNEYRIER